MTRSYLLSSPTQLNLRLNAMSTPTHPYKISTASLPSDALKTRKHPIDPRAGKGMFKLGDATGLTQLGVHLCRLEPGQKSTVLHWHTSDDEWIYVLTAAPGAKLLIRENADQDDAETRDEEIVAGDFLGFPAGVKNAHALQAGEGEVTYLVGGTRKEIDLCTYPEVKITAVIERKGAIKQFAVKEQDMLRK